MLWRIGCAIERGLPVKACNTLAILAGVGWGKCTKISKREGRSTNMPTALALARPLIKSPS